MSSRKLNMIMALAVMAAPVCLYTHAAAQTQPSHSATIQASVTVEPLSITVVPVNDLLFGTQFTSAGIVPQQQGGEWLVQSNAHVSVDLIVSVLPSGLTDGAGNSVPLSYGVGSLEAPCQGVILKSAHPSVGITDCLLASSSNSTTVVLGPRQTQGSSVDVDLTGAPPGTYTATIELTATIR